MYIHCELSGLCNAATTESKIAFSQWKLFSGRAALSWQNGRFESCRRGHGQNLLEHGSPASTLTSGFVKFICEIEISSKKCRTGCFLARNATTSGRAEELFHTMQTLRLNGFSFFLSSRNGSYQQAINNIVGGFMCAQRSAASQVELGIKRRYQYVRSVLNPRIICLFCLQVSSAFLFLIPFLAIQEDWLSLTWMMQKAAIYLFWVNVRPATILFAFAKPGAVHFTRAMRVPGHVSNFRD